jgi:hypothetical protein
VALEVIVPLCRRQRNGGARSTGDCAARYPPTKEKHYASIIEPEGVAELLLQTIDSYQGYNETIDEPDLPASLSSYSERPTCIQNAVHPKSIVTNEFRAPISFRKSF